MSAKSQLVMRYSLAFIATNIGSVLYYALSKSLIDQPSLGGLAIANVFCGCMWGFLKIRRGYLVVLLAAIFQAGAVFAVYYRTEPLVLMAALLVGACCLAQVVPVVVIQLLIRGDHKYSRHI